MAALQPDDPGVDVQPSAAPHGAERAIAFMARSLLIVALVLIALGAAGVGVALFLRATGPG